MAKGVHHLHKSGYIHRDISLRNFLLEIDERDLKSEDESKQIKTASSPTTGIICEDWERQDQQCVVLGDFGLSRNLEVR